MTRELKKPIERIINSCGCNNTMASISSIKLLDRAYAWYRVKHLDAHANHPLWSLGFQWESVKYKVRLALLQGTYQFQPLDVVNTKQNVTVTTDAEGMFELEEGYRGAKISTSILNTGSTPWTTVGDDEVTTLDIYTSAEARGLDETSRSSPTMSMSAAHTHSTVSAEARGLDETSRSSPTMSMSAAHTHSTVSAEIAGRSVLFREASPSCATLRNQHGILSSLERTFNVPKTPDQQHEQDKQCGLTIPGFRSISNG